MLEDLGEEITGIAAPVAICMGLTVLLVRTLNPDGQSSPGTVYIASIAYQEQVGTHHPDLWMTRVRLHSPKARASIRGMVPGSQACRWPWALRGVVHDKAPMHVQGRS